MACSLTRMARVSVEPEFGVSAAPDIAHVTGVGVSSSEINGVISSAICGPIESHSPQLPTFREVKKRCYPDSRTLV